VCECVRWLNCYGKSESSRTPAYYGRVHAYFLKETPFYGGTVIVRGQHSIRSRDLLLPIIQKKNLMLLTLCILGDGGSASSFLYIELLIWAILCAIDCGFFVVKNNGCYAYIGNFCWQERHSLLIFEIGVRLRGCHVGPVDGYGSRKRLAKEMNKLLKEQKWWCGPTFLEMKTYRYRGSLHVGCAAITERKMELEEYKNNRSYHSSLRGWLRIIKYATGEEI